MAVAGWETPLASLKEEKIHLSSFKEEKLASLTEIWDFKIDKLNTIIWSSK